MRWKGHTRPYIRVVEAALGRPLPDGAIVHHVDEDRDNNAPNNLVVCPDQSYHLMLHARTRIVHAGGDPTTQKLCFSCGVLKVKEEFTVRKLSWDGRHNKCRTCKNAWMKEYRKCAS